MELAWINMLRVAATFAVVLLHATSPVIVFLNDTAGYDWWAANFINAAVRWCVPVFVMVSGALLLDPGKKETRLMFYRKRARRVLVPLIFWSLIYLAISALQHRLTPAQMVNLILRGVPYYHLWFLYMILGLYAVTPFLRTYIVHAGVNEIMGLIMAFFVWGALVGFLGNIGFINTDSIFTRFVPYIGYFLCGYHLRETHGTRISPLLLVWGGLAAVAVIACGTGIIVNQFGLRQGWRFFYDDFCPPVIFSALAVFIIVRQGAHQKWGPLAQMGPRLKQVVEGLTPATFGIYLVHPLVLQLLVKRFNWTSQRFHGPDAIFLVAVAAFLLCYLLVYVLKKMPVISRWIV